jgi:hypothetical protein
MISEGSRDRYASLARTYSGRLATWIRGPAQKRRQAVVKQKRRTIEARPALSFVLMPLEGDVAFNPVFEGFANFVDFLGEL